MHKDRIREKKDKEERIRAIPNMSPMSRQTDLMEYFTLFKATQTKKERAQDVWATHLLPLLNDRFRIVAINMQPSDRDSYSTLKEKLVEADDKKVHMHSGPYLRGPRNHHL